MSEPSESGMPSGTAELLAGGVKTRVRWLFVAGMVAVALVYGLSFYFALLSNQSALARQVPELESVAAKLKSVLVVNTLIFVAIIIASFVALGSVVTSRLFQPLAGLHRDLLGLAGPKLPRAAENRDRGAFSILGDDLAAALSALRERERREIEELTGCAAALAAEPRSEETARRLRDLAAAKAAFAGPMDMPRGNKGKEADEDPLFIQPL
jgi:hypothetical protein